MKGNEHWWVIEDAYDDTESKIGVEGFVASVGIRLPGYGDMGTEDRYGIPIIIEYRLGVPFVIVWGDINSEEPTHVISLEGAAESKRRKDDEVVG